MKNLSIYYNNLPHWQVPHGIYFITFRLHGSLPKMIVQQLIDEKELVLNQLKKENKSENEIKNELKKMHHLYYGKFDALLDNSTFGPHYLRKNDFAKIVADAIFFFDKKRYEVINFCIMSNHVHLILYKLEVELFDALGSIKKFSARKINHELGKTGHRFWQFESYDRIIRNEWELKYYIQYNLMNPVKAKQIQDWKKWKWSYLHPDFQQYAPQK